LYIAHQNRTLAMKITIILGHPDKNSFNHAIADTCMQYLKKKGHSLFFHDLYTEGFDPILPATEIPRNGKIDPVIEQYCNELSQSDAIIIVHPNWWGQPPAILKGYIDRVIRPGIAYEFQEGDNGEGVPVGLLKAKSAIVFNTANTSEERENNIFLDPLETIWKNCIFDLCGVTNFYRKVFRIVVTSSHEERQEWLGEVEETLREKLLKNL
jgi:NAD(P)H dehydrogenase (quinone)